jgi:alcohol dehydrogenase (NADP+)
MEELVRPSQGTRFIGISNFNPAQLEDLLKIAQIKPKVHQFEAHPYLDQSDYVGRHKDLGITVTGYAPLGNTNPVYGDIGKKAPPLLSNNIIIDISKDRKCSPAQVVLAWNVRRGVAVIPKAVEGIHQKENFAAIKNCTITDEDVQKIKLIGFNLRVNTNPCRSINFTCFNGLSGAPYS